VYRVFWVRSVFWRYLLCRMLTARAFKTENARVLFILLQYAVMDTISAWLQNHFDTFDRIGLNQIQMATFQFMRHLTSGVDYVMKY